MVLTLVSVGTSNLGNPWHRNSHPVVLCDTGHKGANTWSPTPKAPRGFKGGPNVSQTECSSQKSRGIAMKVSSKDDMYSLSYSCCDSQYSG